MPDSEPCRRRHEDILALLAELRGLLQPEALRRDPRPVRTLLSSLAGKLSGHPAMADASLSPRPRPTRDERTGKLAGSFMVEKVGLGAAFTAYDRRWQVGAIAADPTAFARESVQVVAALARRIEQVNQQPDGRADPCLVAAASETA